MMMYDDIELNTIRRDINIDDLEHNIKIDNIFDMFDNLGCMYVNINRGRLYRYLNRHFYINYMCDKVNVLDENVSQVYNRPYSWDECDSCHRTKRRLDGYYIDIKSFEEGNDLFEICKSSFTKKNEYINDYENY